MFLRLHIRRTNRKISSFPSQPHSNLDTRDKKHFSRLQRHIFINDNDCIKRRSIQQQQQLTRRRILFGQRVVSRLKREAPSGTNENFFDKHAFVHHLQTAAFQSRSL